MSDAVLYESNETNFNTLGLGPLSKAKKVLVTEERNGVFQLEMVYPTDGPHFKELKINRIIKANAGHELKNQRFRIGKIGKEFRKDGRRFVTVFAFHVSQLAAELPMKPIVNILTLNCEEALRVWKSAILDPNPFVVSSDINTVASTDWHIRNVTNPRLALGGVEGSILDKYGGEYKFDNYHISLLKQRGKRANTIIAYGRNLTDIQQEENIINTYTSIFPYAIYTENEEEKMVTLDGYIVDSIHTSKYPNRKVFPLDLSNEFSDDDKPTKAKLKKLADEYIKNNDVGVPSVSMKVEYIDLAQTLDYKGTAVVEEINLCDEVPVFFEALDINTTAKVIRVVWDHIMDRYDSIELGHSRATFGQIINNIEKQVNQVQSTVNEVQVAANGKNMVFRGPDTPKAQNIGDQWYKPNGDFVELHIWNGQAWEFIMSTKPDPAIQEAIDVLEKEAEKNKAEIEVAIQKANQSIIDAGFAKDAATQSITIAEQATQSANNALLDAKNALSSIDNLDQKVNTEITNINGELSQKVNQTTFNQLKGTVTKQDTQITQNKKNIDLKASQSDVNTLNGKVTATESKLTVQSGQIAGLVTKTDGQTTDIANLKVTAEGINSTVSKVQNGLDNLSIGVRNIFKQSNSNQTSSPGQYDFKNMLDCQTNSRFFKNLERDIEYTLTVKGSANGFGEMRFYIQNPNIYSFNGRLNFIGTGIETKSITFKIPSSMDIGLGFTFGAYDMTLKGGCYIEWAVLTKGNRAATEWTPAPEDLATQAEFSNMQQTVKGIQTTVADKAEQSQVTQIAGQISSVVKNFDNLQIGGRNYILGTETAKTNGRLYDISDIKVLSGKTVAVSFDWAVDNPNLTMFRLNIVTSKNQWSNIGLGDELPSGKKTGRFKKITTFIKIDDDVTGGYINLNQDGAIKGKVTISNLKIELGNTVTDWLPAPEDMATQSQLTQLSNMINLRIEKDKVISQINISPENILIESKLIHLSGKSKIDDAVITNTMIANAAITDAKIQNASISNAKLLSVDAGKIVSGFLDSNRIKANSITADKLTSNAIQIGFNSMGSAMKLSPYDLGFYSGGNLTGRLTSDGMEFWYGSRKIGRMGETSRAGYPSIRGISNSLEYTGDFVSWSYKQTSTATAYTALLTLDPKGLFTGKKGIHLSQDVYISGVTSLYEISTGGNSTQKLKFWSTIHNGMSYPSLVSSTGQAGMFFSSSELYLLRNNVAYPLSKIVNIIDKLTGLGSVAIPTGFASDGTARSWYNLYF